MRKYSVSVIWLLFLLFSTTIKGADTQKDYFALYFNNKRCGYGIQSRQVDGDRVVNSDIMHLELERLGTPIKMEVTETSIETLSGKPLGFQLEQNLAMTNMSIEGSIKPDGTMELHIQNAGNSQTVKRAYPEGAIMSEGLQKIIKQHGLEYGTSYSADVFSPSAMQAFKMTFNVGEMKNVDLLGRVVELAEIKGDYVLPGTGKVSYTIYVDREYNTQKMVLPMAGMNIVMIACSESFARSNLEAAEMMSSMVLKSPVEIMTPDKAKEIKYTIRPKSPETDLHFPVTDNQHVETLKDGRILVTVRPEPGDKNALHYQGNDSEILKSLGETPYIQSNHTEIIRLAESCIKDKKHALDAALAIEAFVGDYIEKKDLSVGYASALEVARSRQGDCTEHALLTAALCRAAGIPSRVVIGVVYLNGFLDMESCFGGHAWTEANIGNKWIGLDAALRTSGRSFDAGHITLATGNGDPGDFFSIIGTYALFEIEKIDIIN